ncbi:hypothetical protein GYMLUDRAFT_840485 [Collybiopsis luxurians FD-317 M1]|uniref:Uncharacterized protein n=1 Tax=Collybiopsis luxurians FD-317 M1 TaxID=944289 RepID=A0A0D0BL35_9AGAR|nr:hypothetical protein GYMLUDRAFT_840485 [Collybiopsis luxurians FD-317 M1]
MPTSDRSSSTNGSHRQRRRKSPVSMYRMDYNLAAAPKQPRPLIKIEPSPKPKPKSRDRAGSASTDHYSSRSPSYYESSQRSVASTSTPSFNSSTKSSKSILSFSLPRFLNKRYKSSPTTTTVFEPPDDPTTPTPISLLPSSPEMEAKAILHPLGDELDPPDEDRSETTVTDDNEIVEVRREPPQGHVTFQTHSRRTSLTLPVIPALEEILEQRPLSPESPPPNRPSRNPKRPKTAPSRSMSFSFTHPNPSLPTPPSPSGALNKVPRPSTAQQPLETRKVESPASSLTRSSSISHSMISSDKSSSPTLTVARRERGQGWSGEWNRGDMQEIIQQLRQLK